MKVFLRWCTLFLVVVAPLVGAWIESRTYLFLCHIAKVAPLVGAWIERNIWITLFTKSFVAPLVGAWIERVCHAPLLHH